MQRHVARGYRMLGSDARDSSHDPALGYPSPAWCLPGEPWRPQASLVPRYGRRYGVTQT